MVDESYVGCFIIREDNKILLQHRDINAKRFPNCWGVFGGKVEKEEDLNEAVIRELKEEINFDCKKFNFLEEIITNERGIIRSLNFFVCFALTKDIENFILCEGDDWNWFDYKEINKLDLIPNLIKALNNNKEKILNFK